MIFRHATYSAVLALASVLIVQPSSAGARVRLENGKITVMDGPFAESKEIVGGYAIMDAKSRDEPRRRSSAR